MRLDPELHQFRVFLISTTEGDYSLYPARFPMSYYPYFCYNINIF